MKPTKKDPNSDRGLLFLVRPAHIVSDLLDPTVWYDREHEHNHTRGTSHTITRETMVRVPG